jgi:hypothetical protein
MKYGTKKVRKMRTQPTTRRKHPLGLVKDRSVRFGGPMRPCKGAERAFCAPADTSWELNRHMVDGLRPNQGSGVFRLLIGWVPLACLFNSFSPWAGRPFLSSLSSLSPHVGLHGE